MKKDTETVEKVKVRLNYDLNADKTVLFDKLVEKWDMKDCAKFYKHEAECNLDALKMDIVTSLENQFDDCETIGDLMDSATISYLVSPKNFK